MLGVPRVGRVMRPDPLTGVYTQAYAAGMEIEDVTPGPGQQIKVSVGTTDGRRIEGILHGVTPKYYLVDVGGGAVEQVPRRKVSDYVQAAVGQEFWS